MYLIPNLDFLRIFIDATEICHSSDYLIMSIVKEEMSIQCGTNDIDPLVIKYIIAILSV